MRLVFGGILPVAWGFYCGTLNLSLSQTILVSVLGGTMLGIAGAFLCHYLEKNDVQ